MRCASTLSAIWIPSSKITNPKQLSKRHWRKCVVSCPPQSNPNVISLSKPMARFLLNCWSNMLPLTKSAMHWRCATMEANCSNRSLVSWKFRSRTDRSKVKFSFYKLILALESNQFNVYSASTWSAISRTRCKTTDRQRPSKLPWTKCAMCCQQWSNRNANSLSRPMARFLLYFWPKTPQLSKCVMTSKSARTARKRCSRFLVSWGFWFRTHFQFFE